MAYPLDGGAPLRICAACAETGGPTRGHLAPQVSWSVDGRLLYLRGDVARTGSNVLAIPLRTGEMFPPLPAPGITRPEDVLRLPGVTKIDQGDVFPGPTLSQYSFYEDDDVAEPVSDPIAVSD
jgi:hypothetical protein